MNVICLGISSVIVVRNLLYPDLQEILSFQCALVMYYIVDTAWLAKWPECSPAPKETLLHHFLSIMFITYIIIIPGGLIAGIRTEIMELNTCLSYLRRLLKPKRYFYLDAIFYVSLILLRHGWVPYMAYWLFSRFSEGIHMKVIFSGYIYLNITYVWWTITLFRIQKKKHHSRSAQDRKQVQLYKTCVVAPTPIFTTTTK